MAGTSLQATVRTAPSPMTPAKLSPLISVVVPTYNRVDRLERVLDRLAVQTVDPSTFEVIVVSDGSTDGTDAYLTRPDLPVEVTAVHQRNGGAGAARNRGVAEAKSDLVLFLDDDVLPAPDLIAEHLAAHEQEGGRVVIGPMLTPDDYEMSPWVAWEQTMLYKQYDSMNAGEYSATARQFYTGNASLPRRIFIESGGFDESLRRAEDVELAFRLADRDVKFHYVDTARGYHFAERSYESWEAIAYAYGRNDIVFARRPGREWMVPFMVWSLSHHHPLVRWTTKAAVASPRARRGIMRATRLVVDAAPRADILRRLARPALSIIYSIRFHEGVADELGGAERFTRLRRTRRLDPSWTPADATDGPSTERNAEPVTTFGQW